MRFLLNLVNRGAYAVVFYLATLLGIAIATCLDGFVRIFTTMYGKAKDRPEFPELVSIAINFPFSNGAVFMAVFAIVTLLGGGAAREPDLWVMWLFPLLYVAIVFIRYRMALNSFNAEAARLTKDLEQERVYRPAINQNIRRPLTGSKEKRKSIHDYVADLIEDNDSSDKAA